MEKLNFNINDVGDDGLLINTEKSPDFFSDLKNSLYIRDGILIQSNVFINVSVEKNDRQLYLTGNLRLKIQSPCSRCMSLVSKMINPRFNLQLMPENVDESELIFNNDTIIDTYKGNIIDITDYLYEILSVSIPVKVLCSEMCRGLCMICGSNLNDRDCGCAMKREDKGNSFSKLKDIKLQSIN